MDNPIDAATVRHARGSFAACLEAVERDRRAGRQKDVVEGETLRKRLASGLLLAHGSRQARLPNSVATRLHMKIEGRAAPAFQDVPVGVDKIDQTELSQRFQDWQQFIGSPPSRRAAD